MSEDSGSTLTGGLWFFSTIVLAALFISAAAAGELTAMHVLLALVILSLAVVGTVYLFRSIHHNTQDEKTKRQLIDSLLGTMSVDDLSALEQRLTEHKFREESLGDYLGDDGELVRRK